MKAVAKPGRGKARHALLEHLSGPMSSAPFGFDVDFPFVHLDHVLMHPPIVTD